MDYDFRGKVAVVSGGSRGIGRAVSERFVQAGASLALAGRTEASVAAATAALRQLAEQAESGGAVLGVVADLSQPEGVRQFVEQTLAELGGADLLVNNVGASGYAPLLQLTDETIVDAWTLKALGAIRLTRALVPSMEARGGGAIVNISGGAGREPGPESIPAGLANSSVRVFTKAVAGDLARRGIAINCITPGLVYTDRHFARARQQAQARGVSVEDVLAELDARSPTGHVTRPEEVAELVLFLASRRVPNLTGAEIVLDGGTSRAL